MLNPGQGHISDRAATPNGSLGEPTPTPTPTPALTLRVATPSDLPAVVRLAALDCARPPRVPVLIAEVGSEILAAVSMADGRAVADPFQRTAEIVAIARLRAAGGAAL